MDRENSEAILKHIRWVNLDETPITNKFSYGKIYRHVGKDRSGCERVHRSQSFGNRNNRGESVVDSGFANNFGLTNTFYKEARKM